MMDLRTLYNLKSKFVAREVGNELILVPLSSNVAQMNELFTLNETGKFIWENVKENTSFTDLENKMTDSFIIDRETAKNDIEIFLMKMSEMFSDK